MYRYLFKILLFKFFAIIGAFPNATFYNRSALTQFVSLYLAFNRQRQNRSRSNFQLVLKNELNVVNSFSFIRILCNMMTS